VTGSIALLATLLSGVLGVVLGVTAAVRGGRFGKVVNSGAGIALFGGSVIIENLFALPGLGQAGQAAASSHDIPALISVVVVATVVVVVVNLVLDLVVAALDPKVRTA
jgi:ABC-type dipeptide/oligopeptide/nickel transport system permease component